MSVRSSTGIFAAIRQDGLAWLLLAVFVLILPFLHPLSEARAANRPFSAALCTTFGQSDKTGVPGMVDDCPLCIVSDKPSQLLKPDAIIGDAHFDRNAVPQAVIFNRALAQQLTKRTVWFHPPGQAPPLEI